MCRHAIIDITLLTTVLKAQSIIMHLFKIHPYPVIILFAYLIQTRGAKWGPVTALACISDWLILCEQAYQYYFITKL